MKLQFTLNFYSNSHKPRWVLDATKTVPILIQNIQFGICKKTKSCLTGTVAPHVSSLALTSAPIALFMKLLHFVTNEARETSSAGVLSAAAGSPTSLVTNQGNVRGGRTARSSQKAAHSPQPNMTYGLTNSQLAWPSQINIPSPMHSFLRQSCPPSTAANTHEAPEQPHYQGPTGPCLLLPDPLVRLQAALPLKGSTALSPFSHLSPNLNVLTRVVTKTLLQCSSFSIELLRN